MILDSGATKACAGKKAVQELINILDDETKDKIEYHEENRNFKFGNDKVFHSCKGIIIPIKLGKLSDKVHFSVVDANIPFLLGRPEMKRLGFVVDYDNNSVKIKKTGQV